MVAFPEQVIHKSVKACVTIRKFSAEKRMRLAAITANFFRISDSNEEDDISIKSWSHRMIAFLKQVFVITHATIRKFSDEEGMHLAAGIAYYALLSILPAVLLFVSIFSFFAQPEEITTWLIDILGDETPISPDFLLETVEGATALRSLLGIIGLAGLILTSTLVFAAMMRAINRAWGLLGTGTRSFMRRKLWELSLLTGTAIFLLVSYAGAQLFRLVREIRFTGNGLFLTSDSILWSILSNLYFLTMLSFILFLLYMWVPTVKVKWRNALLPGVLAAVAIMIANYFLGWYFTNWAYYDAVYGSLTSVIVLLLWVYVCANILIIGAALSSVLSTPGRQPPDTDSVEDI